MAQQSPETFPPSCPYCRKSKETQCLFAQFALFFASQVDMPPEEKLVSIAEARKKARERMCPHLNDINPHYDGEASL